LTWIPALILGLIGAVLWTRYSTLSIALMGLAWIAYELFSVSWSYILALLHGVAISYVYPKRSEYTPMPPAACALKNELPEFVAYTRLTTGHGTSYPTQATKLQRP
jgi:hypothetical protein